MCMSTLYVDALKLLLLLFIVVCRQSKVNALKLLFIKAALIIFYNYSLEGTKPNSYCKADTLWIKCGKPLNLIGKKKVKYDFAL